jgi:acetyl esterase/lipase
MAADAVPSWPPVLDAPHVRYASGVTMYHAIEYAVVEGFRPLQIDLYLPPRNPEAPTPPAPAIVHLHGGGWAVGSRRRFGRAFRSWIPTPQELLAQAGFAVASVDYRLSGEAVFPAQLHDAKAAVRWLRANALILQVDPGRIVAWGESAGGQLALMLGLTGKRPDLAGAVGDALGESSDVCAVVDWYGVTDFSALDGDRLTAGSFESRLLGGPLRERADLASLASPVTHVHADAPPIHIHHGDADTVVSYGQSELLVRALRNVGCEVELITHPGGDHFWTGVSDIAAIFNASLAFARAHTA